MSSTVHTTVVCLVLCALAMTAGCAETPPPADDENAAPEVVAAIAPLASLAGRVAGDRARVSLLLPPDASPAAFDPTPTEMATLQTADLLLRIRVPFEDRLLERIGRIWPHLTIVDTTRGIERVPVGGHHHHGEEGEDDEVEHPDPHVWLDPLRAITLAENIADALAEADPEGADGYRERLAALTADLRDLHTDLTETLAPVRGRTMLVFHPAFGYFARRYGLEQVAIEVEGKEPTLRQLSELIREAGLEGHDVIFVQPTFPQVMARRAAEAIGGRVVELDPLPRDYLEGMRTMGRKVAEALADAAPHPHSDNSAEGAHHD